MNAMNERISRLQERMAENAIDVYYVPTGDPHGSEMVHDKFKICEFLTGFTGENATLVVTKEKAKLWTDGRFFIQGEIELSGSGVALMKDKEPGVPDVLDYMVETARDIASGAKVRANTNVRSCENEAHIGWNAANAREHSENNKVRIGFDGNLVTCSAAKSIETAFAKAGVDVELVSSASLADNGMEITHGIVWNLPLSVTGETVESKLTRVQRGMVSRGADYLLVSNLMEIAWLFNMRGGDIPYTPVFYSYVLIGRTTTEFFVMKENIDAVKRIAVGKSASEDECRKSPSEYKTYRNSKLMQPENIDGEMCETADVEIRSEIEVRPYEEIEAAFAEIPGSSTVWFDPETTSCNLAKAIKRTPERTGNKAIGHRDQNEVPGHERSVIEEPTPVQLMEASKNETELQAIRNAHMKDGAAMVRLIKFLKDWAKAAIMNDGLGVSSPAKAQGAANVWKLADVSKPASDGKQDPEPLTELNVARLADSLRKEAGAFDISFETIAAYGENAAIVHYTPKEPTEVPKVPTEAPKEPTDALPEKPAELEPEGFILIDSGGQYPDGTTDITRTVALGPLTDEMKENYTRVLKGHIAFARSIIKPGETGKVLDEVGRLPLREVGLDFNHSISHGVGHVLGVHEPSGVIKRYGESKELIPGMVMSNEPGVYLEGKYGIRIENEVYCKTTESGKIRFENLTMCPYEREAINTKLLTSEERKWVDEYHAEVLRNLRPLLREEEIEFLKTACAPL